MNDMKQDNKYTRARAHCPADVEPDYYVKTTTDEWLPLVAVRDQRGPVACWAWQNGEITNTGCSETIAERLVAEGNAFTAEQAARLQANEDAVEYFWNHHAPEGGALSVTGVETERVAA